MYKLAPKNWGDVVIRLSDNTFIPFVKGNADYEVYLKWLDGWEYINREWVKVSESNTPLQDGE